MAKVLVTDTYLSNIADAIREKNGGSATYTPGQMAGAIAALPDVPVLVAKTITANGEYDPEDDNADGYSGVTVAVPSSQPNLQSKTATQNGTVLPDAGYDGLSSVVVNVAGSGLEAIEPLERMHTKSRIQSGVWYGSANDGNNVIEVYSVDPAHKYLYVLGETVQIANLCTSAIDPRTVTSGTRNLNNITSTSNPIKRMATNVEPSTYYIYFVAQIANDAQYANIRGYLYDITGLTGTVS